MELIFWAIKALNDWGQLGSPYLNDVTSVISFSQQGILLIGLGL